MTKAEEKQIRKLVENYYKAVVNSMKGFIITISNPLYKLVVNVEMCEDGTSLSWNNVDLKFKSKNKFLKCLAKTTYDAFKSSKNFERILFDTPEVKKVVAKIKSAEIAADEYIRKINSKWRTISDISVEYWDEFFVSTVMDAVLDLVNPNVVYNCPVNDEYGATIRKGSSTVKVGCQSISIENVRNIVNEWDKLNA